MNKAAELIFLRQERKRIESEIENLENSLSEIEFYDYQNYDHTYVEFIHEDQAHICCGKYEDDRGEEMDYEDKIISLEELSQIL
ncbi:hypothetical protein EBB07_28380 [Paenibacillaceae bacterium]|nr:hypothetical protein EBB07_28380 [Paenibacillaceae bacterium]